jgi:hypothetical protein
VSAVGGPFVTAAGGVFGVYIGLREGRKRSKADAAQAGEEAANKAREAVTADWAAYSRSMQEDRKMLSERLAAVEQRHAAAERRIDAAETRAVIAEERATRWESLYRIAVHHMRELIQWASDISHMTDMPQAPAELQSEL